MKITEEMLYEHAGKAEELWLSTFPSNDELPEHEFSKGFERKMNKLLRTQRRSPSLNRFISVSKRIAAILLIISIGFGTVIAVSPTARAAVINWVMEWYDTHISYRFFGESTWDEMPSYNITKLPNGYKKVEEIRKIMDTVIIMYENEDEDMIYFNYSRMRDGMALGINIENMELYEIKVHDCSGHFYESKDPQESNTLVWFDEQEKIKFLMDGFYSKDELLEMAESVALDKTMN